MTKNVAIESMGWATQNIVAQPPKSDPYSFPLQKELLVAIDRWIFSFYFYFYFNFEHSGSDTPTIYTNTMIAKGGKKKANKKERKEKGWRGEGLAEGDCKTLEIQGGLLHHIGIRKAGERPKSKLLILIKVVMIATGPDLSFHCLFFLTFVQPHNPPAVYLYLYIYIYKYMFLYIIFSLQIDLQW